ncbi:uncharacterized protein LOC143448358 isoform X2 [Clavelina lepadiformis]|uniref:uncharacterized protein LOC143448358 isoform X2 n=1 Tax=Clavelina lepadiformis TaxID=159417 RepID=UPI0040411C99
MLKAGAWWIHGTQCNNEYFGYCLSVEKAEKVLEDFQEITSCKYVVQKKIKHFGEFGIDLGKHCIRFQGVESKLAKDINPGPTIPFFGLPFVILAEKVFECQYGVDRHAPSKQRKRIESIQANKARCVVQPSMKRGCPARVIMKEVAVFPEYRIKNDTVRNRKLISKELRGALQNNEKPQVEKRIYLQLPWAEMHDKHAVKSLHDFNVEVLLDNCGNIDGQNSSTAFNTCLSFEDSELFCKAKECRETLQEISSLTYLTTNLEALVEASDLLEQAKVILKQESSSYNAPWERISSTPPLESIELRKDLVASDARLKKRRNHPNFVIGDNEVAIMSKRRHLSKTDNATAS